MMTSRSKILGRSASSHRRSHARRATSEPWLSRALSYLYVSKETEAFNGFLYTFGRRHVKFLHLWFTGGVGFSLLAMVAGILVLAWEATRFLTTLFSKETSPAVASPLIIAVVPGVNVPFSDVGYMAFALVLAIGIHEFGHGIAAASEGVPIEHVAVFLAFVFPGALVALKRETLHLLSPFRTLRIYCAGIWHNAVCCAGCWFLLLVLPLFLYPFYSHGRGAVVLAVPLSSPLAGYIRPGDMISHINERRILNSRDWFLELNRMHKDISVADFSPGGPGGFCVSRNDLEKSLAMQGQQQESNTGRSLAEMGKNRGLDASKTLVAGEVKRNQTDSSSGQKCPDGHLFFSEVKCLGDEGESKSDDKAESGGHCLRAQNVVQNPKCGYLSASSTTKGSNCSCPKGEQCLQPELSIGEVLFTLDVMRSKPCNDKLAKESSTGGGLLAPRGVNDSFFCEDQLLVVMDPLDISSAVDIVNYRPHILASIASVTVSAPLWLPYMVEKLISYILQYSAGLAVANSIPVFYLDGEAFLQSLMSMLIPFMRPSRRRRLQFLLLCAGTTLLFLGVLPGIYALVLQLL